MMDIFVAVSGNDSHPGTREQPVSSLEQARRMLSGGGTAWLDTGTWYLPDPLFLGPEDAGISFRALPGEKPAISGGMRVQSRWQPWERGIWRCSVMPGLVVSELFFNGKRCPKARYPDEDLSVPGKTGYIHAAPSDSQWPHTWMKFDPATFTKKHWGNPVGAVLHIFPDNYWGNLQWEIKSIDWDNHVIHFGKGGYQIHHSRPAASISEDSRFFIENVFEELDALGEWFYNPEGWLHYMPRPDEDLNTAIVETSSLKQLVRMCGSEETPVRDVCFEGIRFANAAPTYLDEYMTPSRGDWTLHRGGAVVMNGCEGCAITDCFFDAVGGNGVFLDDYNKDCRISGNLFSETGESAVVISGTKNRCAGSQHPFSERITVENNHMHHLGHYGKQTAGVFLSVTRRNIVRRNHIHHVPRAAICINDGTWGGHLIEGNDIHDTTMETGDHGPFNAWGRDSMWCHEHGHGPACHGAGSVLDDALETTIIRRNRFADDRGWGIDLDDGASNYIIEENLTIGISVKLREGDWRTVRNNIFINGANSPCFHMGNIDNHDRFERNIIVMNTGHDIPETDVNFSKGKSGGRLYELISPPVTGRWLETMDNNLFWNDIGHFVARVYPRPIRSAVFDYGLEQWQAMGYDIHSIFAAPCFQDSANGDFRLRTDSPAFDLGFAPFPLDEFGPDPRQGNSWEQKGNQYHE